MAVRRFRDNPFSGNHEVVCDPGGCTTLPGGAWTMAALVFCRGDASPIVAFRTGSSRLILQINDATTLLTVVGGFGQTLTVPNMLNQWIVLGASRSAGGDTPIRGHVYYYTGDTFVHDNLTPNGFDEGSTIDNIRLGRNPDGSVSFFGDIGLITAWDVELSDAAFQTLPPGLAPWIDFGPRACWPLNQSTLDPVMDISGNGADQNALVDTTVVLDNDPPFDFSITPPAVTTAIPLTLSVSPVASALRAVAADIPLSLLVNAVTGESLPGRPIMPDATPRSLPFNGSETAEARLLKSYADEREIQPFFE